MKYGCSQISFQIFLDIIHAKGAPLNSWLGFIDGAVRPCCMPCINQRIVKNGHKKDHDIKFQSVLTRNSLIADSFGPVEGRNLTVECQGILICALNYNKIHRLQITIYFGCIGIQRTPWKYSYSGISNPLSISFTKWSNTLKQFVGHMLMNCLSVCDHFVGLALKGLRVLQLLIFNKS